MTSRAKLSRSSRSSRKPKLRAGSPSTRRPVREAALAEVKDDLSRFLRLAESEEILITRHGKPAGVLIGFESEDEDRKSTRLNSSHDQISYAVFCLKKKKIPSVDRLAIPKNISS